MSEPKAQDSARDGRADFDFFVGRWQSHHWRLRERLKGSDVWEEFEGTTVARQILGGLGNIDEITMERASGRVEGLTVRLYDPAARQWSLHWAASGNVGGFQTPTIGEFKDGRGEFFAQEAFEGRSIFVRFTWSDITPTSCRWEQAFSADGGKTWETNWITEFTRRE